MMQQNFAVLKGDTFGVTFVLEQLVDDVWRPIDLTGEEVRFVMQWPEGRIEKSTHTGQGLSITDGAGGLVRLDLSKMEIEMPPEGDIAYRLQRVTTDEAKSVLLGHFKIKDFP